MAIITVSRELGSLGTDVAQAVAKGLKYDYLDKEGFNKALGEHGFSAMKLEKYDEKKPPLWDVFSSDRDRFLLFMKMVIYNFAEKGNVVIVGRGGQILLKDLPGTLTVRIEAPHGVRLQRISEAMSCDAKQAEHIIASSDHDRNGFHKFFFNIDWNRNDVYDLVINTKTLAIESCVAIIKSAVKSKEVGDRLKEAKVELGNLSLSQRVEAHILYEEEVPIQYLEVTAQEGVVILRGAVTTMQIADRCEEVARTVEGVKDVVNEFSLINYYGMM
jgi:cytidylate kinase